MGRVTRDGHRPDGPYSQPSALCQTLFSSKVAMTWTLPSYSPFQIPEATTLSPQSQQSWHQPAGDPPRTAQETGEGEARPVLPEVKANWHRCCLALSSHAQLPISPQTLGSTHLWEVLLWGQAPLPQPKG